MALSRLERWLSNSLLLSFMCISLPITTLLLWFNYAAVVLAEQRGRFFSRQRHKSPRTILITGASNAYGLNVAQAFFKSGHRVVSVNLQRRALLNIARRSRAISKHYTIPQLSASQDDSYTARCLFIVAKNERADLWIDCSQDIGLDVITSAQQQIEQTTSCVCITPNNHTVQLLKNKEALLDFLRDRQLPAPELYRVKSRGEIHNVLNRSQGKKQFLLTSAEKPKATKPRTMLPRRTVSQTYQEVSTVKIGPNSHLVLEEYLDPSNTYQCSAIVVQGTTKMFSARQRTGDINSSFRDGSALWRALRAYTDAIAHELGQPFTGHLALLFLLNEKVTNAGVAQQVVPLEGSVHIDPTFLLHRDGQAPDDLVSAYMSALPHESNGVLRSNKQGGAPTTSVDFVKSASRQRYFLSDSFDELVLRPCIGLLRWQTSPAQAAGSVLTFAQRVLFWDEAFYDFRDPMPALWRYTVVLAWETLVGF